MISKHTDNVNRTKALSNLMDTQKILQPKLGSMHDPQVHREHL